MSGNSVDFYKIRCERHFLNSVHYRSKFDVYDKLLYMRISGSKSYDYKIYYDKMYLIYSYHLKFCGKLHDCVAAASDFAIQIKEIKNELDKCLAGTKIFTRFEEFFNHFEFAMVEFEIAYFRMQCPQSVNKKSTGNLNTKDARNYVVEKYFSGKLLKNCYEIELKAKEELEKTISETKKSYQDAVNDLRDEGYQIYHFPSEISAIYHYRKHGVKDQLENNKDEFSFKTYLMEAYVTIKNTDSSQSSQSRREINNPDYDQIAVLQKGQKGEKTHLVSYFRHYKK
jgi:hypothetical protein